MTYYRGMDRGPITSGLILDDRLLITRLRTNSLTDEVIGAFLTLIGKGKKIKRAQKSLDAVAEDGRKIMNIQAIKEGLTIAGNVIGILKSVQDKLPAGKKKGEVERLLLDAEEKIKEAEARIGHELGFPICKRCWPPEIMIHNDDGNFVCRSCGKQMPVGLSPEIPMADDLSTW